MNDRNVLDRLAHVERMLSDARTLDGVRVRCGAWLLRTTLERAVVALCAARCGPNGSMHAMLLSLPRYLDDDVAEDTAQLWHALCRAAHHHDYEIAPTVDELRGWHCDTARLADALLAELPDLLPRPRVEAGSRRRG
ncbi:hypothetical protein [Umezawaea tangerina]|uniref:HEPN domain-containing protein n=1 Tax=Umezawaea tangerina TaxID=84725 RepID=A0A2T0SCB4_9PSEU|nr:hypothetical protein [Umezawaea tangerina]PRY31021.1 hypothetical protein CLV43_123123 [Umezawaea tangerina]